jgi:hypothetical protein
MDEADGLRLGQRVGFTSLARDARGFRSRPEEAAPIVSWPIFLKCTVEEVQAEWARLRLSSGTEGWVRTKYLRASLVSAPVSASDPPTGSSTVGSTGTSDVLDHGTRPQSTSPGGPEVPGDQITGVLPDEKLKSCPVCATEWPDDSTFCGSCGARIDAASGPSSDRSGVLNTDAPIEVLDVPTRHLTPDAGIQAMVDPDPGGALGRFLPARTAVLVSATQGSWARVRLDGEPQGAWSWVDGRQLIPATVSSAPRTIGFAGPAGQTALGASEIVGVVGGAGIVAGALFDWYSFGLNAFHIPVSFLFDKTTVDQDPKMAYFLLGLGIVGAILSFVRGAEGIRFLCGALALGAAILFAVQIGDAISSSSSVNVTDVIGAGPWVTGISGLALLISPFLVGGGGSRGGVGRGSFFTPGVSERG